jgi:hypothetical protein
LRPRREDAPTEAGLCRRRGRGDENAEDRLRRQEADLDASDGPALTEVDATLRPLARALLALAEQLMGEEAP